MKSVALVAALLLLAFAAVFSLDVGCFICLYGEERGGVTEKWINGVLAAAVIIVIVTLLWPRLRE